MFWRFLITGTDDGTTWALSLVPFVTQAMSVRVFNVTMPLARSLLVRGVSRARTSTYPRAL